MEPVVYTPVSAVANLRRAVRISVLLAAVAVAVTSLVGHPLMGVFFAVGLAVGALNNRMLQRAVIVRASSRVSSKRFNGGVAMRLGGITLIVFGVPLLIRPDGLGVVVGVAVFHLVMLIGAAFPLLRSLRPQV